MTGTRSKAPSLCPQQQHVDIDVSMVSLIANPLSYHGKRIRVVGVSNTDFVKDPSGFTILFLTKEHSEAYLVESGVQV